MPSKASDIQKNPYISSQFNYKGSDRENQGGNQMLKTEFETLIGTDITDEEYEKIETVYTYNNKNYNKQDIVDLYFAVEIDKEYEIIIREKEIDNLKQQLEKMTKENTSLIHECAHYSEALLKIVDVTNPSFVIPYIESLYEEKLSEGTKKLLRNIAMKADIGLKYVEETKNESISKG